MLNALKQLLSGESLTRTRAREVMEQMVDGRACPEQVGALLTALRLKGETADELLGFVDCLESRATRVHAGDDCIDVCGTGGDGSGTFNISTAVAFVVAGAGQPVAKHGNRSVSSRSGSFDVLEVLGLRFESDPAAAERQLATHGLALLFAPAFHPVLKSLGPIRKNLGFHTAFNALGPLLNPAGVKRQLIGVYSAHLVPLVAEVLKAKGAVRAMVVRGEDGLDELSLCSPTQVASLLDGRIELSTVNPEALGLERCEPKALKGGEPKENAQLVLEVLKGEGGPRRDVVLLNAAAALWVGEKASDLKSGIAKATEAIDSGRALGVLRAMGGRV